MSRTGLHRPRHTRAVSHRPATDTRLLPNPFPHPNTHNKRCPKAQRLSLGSDQSPPRPQYCLVPVTGNGRFLNSNRLALLHGQHRRISAPVPGRIYVAGIDLAGESEQPGDIRLQGFKPTQDSTVVTIGELQMLDDGFGSRLPALTVVECHWWTGKPHTETFSGLVHLLKNVWGCRRVVVDATGTGADVAAFLLKTIEPSTVVPFTFTAQAICTPTPIGNPSPVRERGCPVRWRGIPSFLPSIELEAEVGAREPTSASVLLPLAPLDTRNPQKSLQASFNQNSYEFNQRLIYVQSTFNQNPNPPPCIIPLEVEDPPLEEGPPP